MSKNNEIKPLKQPAVSSSTCGQIFEQASKIDDYEFNLHQHWKDEDDRTGFDSKPIGGFSD